ncbi:uncharacterized protein LOC110460395 [Mizuhopecten yessoensis]|uniref:uncharacterized protein LOC110460395 n=1 Tax=Mizuhopecten yessoensis TaxID=6573 RepID=UPI000B45A067|nr:uncharacterized protein LOC110460395 [Mizuhopecten yessoensis]
MDVGDQNNRTTDLGKVHRIGCVGNTGRRFLLAMNIVVIVVGVLVVIAGFLLKTQQTAIHAVSDALLNGVKAATTSSGLTGTDLSTFDLAGIIDSAADGCISIGVILCVVAMFGLYGIKSKNETVLIMYASVIGTLVIAELVFLIVMFKLRSKVDESLKAPLRDLINTQYAGFDGSDVVSVAFNFIMIKLSCCGVDGFSDFYRAAQWPKLVQTNGSIDVPLLTPLACCKPEVRTRNNYACAANPTNQNSNYRQGCYNSIWDEVYSHNTLIITCATGVGLFELLLIFFASWVAHEIRVLRKRKPRRPVRNLADVQLDTSSASEGGREMPISVLSTNRASATGNNVSIRRDSDGSVHIFPDPNKIVSNKLSSSLEPPPYTSSHFLPQRRPTFMNFPIAQSGITASQSTPFPFETSDGQCQGFTRCSSVFQGHSECNCQRRRSGCCCSQEQMNYMCGNHGDHRGNSISCACEESGSNFQGQRHLPEKSFSTQDQLPPPYNGGQYVASTYSCSASGYAIENANTINEKSSIKTNSNALLKSQSERDEFGSGPRNSDVYNSVTSAHRHPIKMNQNMVTNMQLPNTEDSNTNQGMPTSLQACAEGNDVDATPNSNRSNQQKRSLFNRRSISGPCTKAAKDDAPLHLRMRSQSFVEY